MLADRLQKMARRDKARADRVRAWRLAEDWPSFLLYLYWRNRFPILTKICNRTILILEVYLLYELFQLNIAAGLSFLLFAAFALRGALRGVSQYFRLKIISGSQEQDSYQVKKQLGLMLTMNSFLSFSLALALCLSALLLGLKPLTVLFLTIFCIILPLEMLSSSLWAAVYTEHRLQRNFGIVLTCRLIPCIFILLGHNFLGAYTYLLGLLCGRVLEHCYLSSIALAAHRINDHLPDWQLSGLRSAIRDMLQGRSFWEHALFPLPFQIYNLSLGLFLYLRSDQLWLAYFFFVHTLMIFTFLGVRMSSSLGMDIYLALRKTDLTRAKRLKFRSEQVLLLVVLMVIALSLSLFIGNLVFVGVHNHYVFQLWIYFLAALAARSWYYAQVAFQRAAGCEPFFNAPQGILFLCLSLPLQAVAVFIWRGNLQFILCIDIFAVLLMGLLLSRADTYSLSPIYNRALDKKILDGHIVPARNWLAYLATCRRLVHELRFLLVQLDSRYHYGTLKTEFLRRVATTLRHGELGITLYPGLILYLLPGYDEAQTRQLTQQLESRFAGHIRNTIALQPHAALEQHLHTVLSKLRLTERSERRIRALLNQTTTILAGKYWQEIGKEFAKLDSPFKSGDQVADLVKELVVKYGFGDLPRIILKDGKPEHWKSPNLHHLQFAEHVATSYISRPMLLQSYTRPIAVISVFGQPCCLLDTSGLEQLRGEEVFQFSSALSLLATLMLARHVSSAELLPARLYEYFRDNVTNVNVRELQIRKWCWSRVHTDLNLGINQGYLAASRTVYGWRVLCHA